MKARPLASLALPLLLALASACATAPNIGPAPQPGTWVAEVALTVADADAATAWFADALGAREVGTTPLAAEDGVAVALKIGEQRIQLRSFDGVASHEGPRGNDLAFQHLAVVVGDMDAVHREVVAAGIAPISPGPQRIPDSNAAAAGIRAFYFHGPGAHPLELIWYPANKGREIWHRPESPTVLGIDHTAITVSDTDASLAFYRDLLGLEVVGGSFNEGVEQERLSGVDGARVRITALRGRSGMGLELLEYVAPQRTQPRPRPAMADTRYAETTLVVADLGEARERLEQAGAPALSSDFGTCTACTVGRRDFIVLDPDAHPIRLVEE